MFERLSSLIEKKFAKVELMVGDMKTEMSTIAAKVETLGEQIASTPAVELPNAIEDL